MIKPRVLFRSQGCVCLGPLGCFDLDDAVMVEGVEYTVRRIDADGAAVACLGDTPPLRFPGRGTHDATQFQRESITRQILANRKAHGLNDVDPRRAQVEAARR